VAYLNPPAARRKQQLIPIIRSYKLIPKYVLAVFYPPITTGTRVYGRSQLGRFHDFHLHGKAHLELDFLVGNQVKGLILPLRDIQKLESVLFQHPKYPGCVLFDLFAGDEFAQPCPDAMARKAELERQSLREKDEKES
jgi:hypothetical protein